MTPIQAQQRAERLVAECDSILRPNWSIGEQRAIIKRITAELLAVQREAYREALSDVAQDWASKTEETPMPDNHIDLTIVVNGQPTVVQANKNAPLRTVIAQALVQTGNAGQPPDSWELRDAAGAPLALDQKISDFNFPADVRLFLNLKAGGGAV